MVATREALNKERENHREAATRERGRGKEGRGRRGGARREGQGTQTENKTQKRSQNPIGSRFPDSVKLNLNPRMHNAGDTKRQPKANRNDTPRTSMDAKGVDNLHAWTIHITAPMQHYTNKHAMNPSVVHDLLPVPARG